MSDEEDLKKRTIIGWNVTYTFKSFGLRSNGRGSNESFIHFKRRKAVETRLMRRYLKGQPCHISSLQGPYRKPKSKEKGQPKLPPTQHT